jgi:hypothetical protein
VARDSFKLMEKREEAGFMMFVPVIITTARLMVGDPREGDIQLASGKSDTMRFREAGIVRFRKSLASPDLTGSETLRAAARSSERTTFVVNSTALADFLRRWTEV